MISVIVCSQKDPLWEDHERNVKATIGSPFEYIRIPNAPARFGICGAYNEGVTCSRGDILVFVHEDVFFMECGWGPVLINKFLSDSTIGLIGIAGTQYLFADNRYWCAAGTPFTRGRIIQLTENNEILLTVFNPDQNDAEVIAVDGLFFAIRRDLFTQISFDDDTFKHFHFYDLDICMQIHKFAKSIVTWDILVKHLSLGEAKEEFLTEGQKFINKYTHLLPLSCVDKTPSSSLARGIKNYKLEGILPPTLLVPQIPE